MKNKKVLLFTIVFLFLSVPFYVSANSSWCWISETRPYDILPWVALATILIETWMIIRYGKTDEVIHVIAVVILVNFISFVFPYIIYYASRSMMVVDKDFRSMLEHWPAYTVGGWFLVLTIVLEVPILYFDLKEKVANKKSLLKILIIANVLTTLMVAVVERIACRGRW